MKRVTGIGGIFFKTKDPEKLKQWYSTHLGIKSDKQAAVSIGENLMEQKALLSGALLKKTQNIFNQVKKR